MKRFVIATTAVALFAAAYPATAQQEDLKVYISADMEGVVGVVTSDQLGPSGFEYQRFRAIMTREVNAAIDAAREMGATEILVSDSHGNGENLLIEDLPPDVQLIRGWPRPHMMMEGIDETFDAAILIGYHSSTTNTRGVRAHTISSANLTAVRLNGVEMLEASINAAIAGDFGVPVVMISGDDAVIEGDHAQLLLVEPARVVRDREQEVITDRGARGARDKPTTVPDAIGRDRAAHHRHRLRRDDLVRTPRLEQPPAQAILDEHVLASVQIH